MRSGWSRNASSVNTYSAVARVSRSASTRASRLELGIQRRSWAPSRSNHISHTINTTWTHSSRSALPRYTSRWTAKPTVAMEPVARGRGLGQRVESQRRGLRRRRAVPGEACPLTRSRDAGRRRDCVFSTAARISMRRSPRSLRRCSMMARDARVTTQNPLARLCRIR